ncbi:MAG: class I SAM-dependent methyltransferase [Microthrixaceae bacterium]
MTCLNAQFDDDPDGYDARREGWLFERRLRELRLHLDTLRDGDTVVEVGSGTGLLLRRLAAERPALRFVGVEPIEGYVDFARSRAAELPNLRFEVGTGERLAESDPGRADLVLTNDVLHHVEDLDATCAGVGDVARPWTQWVAIEPNPQNPWVIWYHTRTEGEALFRPRAFLAAAARHGWSAVQRAHLFLVPQAIARPPRPLVLAERGLERLPVLSGGSLIRLVRGSGDAER